MKGIVSITRKGRIPPASWGCPPGARLSSTAPLSGVMGSGESSPPLAAAPVSVFMAVPVVYPWELLFTCAGAGAEGQSCTC
jgi:hypothetical protein